MTTAEASVAAGLAVAAAALLVGVLAWASTRSVGTALAVLLDLLLAAGLLRLAVAQTWAAIGTAALVVVVRKLAGAGIAAARRSLHDSPPPRSRLGAGSA